METNTRSRQNDVEYLSGSRLVASLFRQARWFETGLDECDLSDWQSSWLSFCVSGPIYSPSMGTKNMLRGL